MLHLNMHTVTEVFYYYYYYYYYAFSPMLPRTKFIILLSQLTTICFLLLLLKIKQTNKQNTLFKPLPFLSHSFKNKTRKTKPDTCDLHLFSQALFQTIFF